MRLTDPRLAYHGALLPLETDDFTRVLNVNLLGVFLCTRFVAKHMIERNHGGRIINIT